MGAEAGRRTSRPLPIAIAAVLACVLPVAALVAVAAALDLGADAPWTFTLMVADGQIGLVTMLAAAFLAASLAGLVALSLRATPPSRTSCSPPPRLGSPPDLGRVLSSAHA